MKLLPKPSTRILPGTHLTRSIKKDKLKNKWRLFFQLLYFWYSSSIVMVRKNMKYFFEICYIYTKKIFIVIITTAYIYAPLLDSGLLSEREGFGSSSHAGRVRVGNTDTVELLRRLCSSSRLFSFALKIVVNFKSNSAHKFRKAQRCEGGNHNPLFEMP